MDETKNVTAAPSVVPWSMLIVRRWSAPNGLRDRTRASDCRRLEPCNAPPTLRATAPDRASRPTVFDVEKYARTRRHVGPTANRVFRSRSNSRIGGVVGEVVDRKRSGASLWGMRMNGTVVDIFFQKLFAT